MHEFFSFNFPLREYYFCTSHPPPPINFLMVRPLMTSPTKQLLILFTENLNVSLVPHQKTLRFQEKNDLFLELLVNKCFVIQPTDNNVYL